jgi:L-ribulose-5-phosphate 3-epimerase
VRLSVVTDEIDEHLPAALDVCRDLGVTTVEIRSVDGRNIVEHSTQSIAGLQRMLIGRGVRVCAIASPFLKCEADSDPNAAWRDFERSLRIARKLRAPLVRAFSFWRVDDPSRVLPRLVPMLRSAAGVAARAGVRLVIENEHSCNVATGEEAAEIVRACRPAELGVIWDPANEARYSPATAVGVGGFAAVREHVAHVHLKDVDAAGNWVRIGAGIIDHAALLHALERDRYPGCLSVETHYSIHGSREAATRECVAAVRAIWATRGASASRGTAPGPRPRGADRAATRPGQRFRPRGRRRR